MSKINDLISTLCPDGVPFKRLGEIGHFYSGLSGKSKDDFKDGNAVLITYMNVYSNLELKTDVEDRVRVGENEKQNTVQYGDVLFTGSSETPDECGMSSVLTTHTDNKLYLNSFCFGYRFDKPDRFLPGFTKHLFRSDNLRNQITKTASGVTRFNVSKKKMENVKIPVPPLEVQREIVRVLDNFTLLTAELTAELTARKKQYAYYRDLLLTINSSVPECSMGEVLTFLNGRAYKQQELLDAGKYPVLRVGNFYTNSSWYYSDLELEEDKYCDKGDLLYSWAATLGPKIWNGGKCIYHYHIWKILFDENIIDKMYLYYYLQYDLSEISKSTTHSTMVHVSMGSMKERKIKIPPLNEQRRIAGLISQFDNLCNSILSGLPAEIDVRQKQYEYYRDKLLSFNEMRTEI